MSKEGNIDMLIVPEKVANLQKSWGEAIVAIGKAHTTNDTEALKAATDQALELYDFPNQVLFKPTKASEKQFRGSKDGARSYFIGGDANFPEDHGFALADWTNVRFENTAHRSLTDGSEISMGNYYFTDPKTSEEVKVEYTFGYTPEGKIFLHHSSLPFQPNH